jgi:hypothetical protein
MFWRQSSFVLGGNESYQLSKGVHRMFQNYQGLGLPLLNCMHLFMSLPAAVPVAKDGTHCY